MTVIVRKHCMCRSDTTQRVLEAAKRRLLDAVPKLSLEQLTSLLEASFAYIGASPSPGDLACLCDWTST